MRNPILVLFVFAILGFLSIPIWPASAAPTFQKTAMDATFAVYGQAIHPVTHQPIHAFLCTAFAYKADSTGYLLLSAGHCVDDEPSDSTFAVTEEIGGQLMKVSVVSARYNSRPYEDYVIFHLATSKTYPVLELGDDTESIDSHEINPNFALGMTKQYAHGVIVSNLMVSSDECQGCAGQVLIHEIAGAGASGSAVISETTHKVIGILVTEVGNTDSGGAGFTLEPISTVKASMLKPDEFEELHQLHDENFLQRMLEELHRDERQP